MCKQCLLGGLFWIWGIRKDLLECRFFGGGVFFVFDLQITTLLKDGFVRLFINILCILCKWKFVMLLSYISRNLNRAQGSQVEI